MGQSWPLWLIIRCGAQVEWASNNAIIYFKGNKNMTSLHSNKYWKWMKSSQFSHLSLIVLSGAKIEWVFNIAVIHLGGKDNLTHLYVNNYVCILVGSGQNRK